ncbi:MAG: Lrp/AsnC family transcriptional regulator [Erysipelotrichaceae bacterium]
MEKQVLLSLLEKKARLSTRDLADILQADEKSILSTMDELEKDKIICGYHTIINWDKTNNDKVMALIEVGVTPEREFGYDRVAKNIYRFPEVDTMYLMSGKSEFTVIVNGKTMQEVSNFVAKLACVEHVTSTVTLFVLKQYKASGVIFDEEEKPSERLIVTP